MTVDMLISAGSIPHFLDVQTEVKTVCLDFERCDLILPFSFWWGFYNPQGLRFGFCLFCWIVFVLICPTYQLSWQAAKSSPYLTVNSCNGLIAGHRLQLVASQLSFAPKPYQVDCMFPCGNECKCAILYKTQCFECSECIDFILFCFGYTFLPCSPVLSAVLFLCHWTCVWLVVTFPLVFLWCRNIYKLGSVMFQERYLSVAWSNRMPVKWNLSVHLCLVCSLFW